MNYKIGFANVRYTLWEVTTSPERTTYHYLHNLSGDVEKVKAQYPGVEIDKSLRGSSDFVIEHHDKQPEVEDIINCFAFGKYRGQLIRRCVDGDYLAWYLDSIQAEERKSVVLAQLQCLGYVQLGRKWFSPLDQLDDEYKELVEEYTKDRKIIECIQAGEPIQIQIDGNPVDHILSIGSVYYKFQTKVCGNSYYGQYELICNPKTGAGMRLKGKTITITDYEYHEVDGWLEVEVKDFAVNK